MSSILIQNSFTTPNGDSIIDDTVDALKVTIASLLAGEDPDKDVMRVQQPFLKYRTTGSNQATSGAGLLHTVTFSATGTITSGKITIYDNTAGSGDILFDGIIQVGINPTTILLDIEYANGIYVLYDGTIANVATLLSFD